MHIGVCMFATDYAIRIDELAREVDFEPLWYWPKPAQQPYPPVLLGGESNYTLQRVVDYCKRLLGINPRSFALPSTRQARINEASLQVALVATRRCRVLRRRNPSAFTQQGLNC